MLVIARKLLDCWNMLRLNIFITVFSLNIMCNTLLLGQAMYNHAYTQEIVETLEYASDIDEIVRLQAPETWFIGLYKGGKLEQASTVQQKGAVILLHGMNGHANWPNVIKPIRTQLPAFGWTTFSIQMPTLATVESVGNYGSLLPSAHERIKAAVDYLHDWDVEPIILLGYGFGAAQAASYLANDSYVESATHIQAFVSVSMLAQKFLKPRLNIFDAISRSTIPMLDIYAENDLPDVHWSIDDRSLAARKNHRRVFRQIELKHAEHDYWHAEHALVEQIQDWLQQIIYGGIK